METLAFFNQASSEEKENSPEEIKKHETAVVGVYDPEKGYLCRVIKPENDGDPLVIKPLQVEEDVPAKDEAFTLVYKFLEKTFQSDEVDDQGSAIPITRHIKPAFREERQLSSTKNEIAPSGKERVKIFDAYIADNEISTALENTGEYVFVPVSLLDPEKTDAPLEISEKSHILDEDGNKTSAYELISTVSENELEKITYRGREIEAFIHPDCGLLYRQPEADVFEEEKLDRTVVRKAARGIINTVEAFDRVSSEGEQLTLGHIDRLRKIVDEPELMDDLETSYIREKLTVMGLQHIASFAAEGALTSGLINDSEGIVMLGLAGSIGIDTTTELALDLHEKSFRVLFTKTLRRVEEKYNLADAGVPGLEDSASFVFQASEFLSEPDAMTSKVAAKWGSVAVNSAVLIANNQAEAAGVYAAVSAGLNLGESIYRKHLSKKELEELHEAKTAKEEELQENGRNLRKAKNIAVKAIGPAAKSATSMAGVFGTRFGTIGVQLATLVAAHQGEQLIEAKQNAERKRVITTLNELINWAEKDATELETQEQYVNYSHTKVQEERNLPNRQTKLATLRSLHGDRETEIEIRRSELGSKREVMEDGETSKTVRYMVVDRALATKHGINTEQLDNEEMNLRAEILEVQRKIENLESTNEGDPTERERKLKELEDTMETLKRTYISKSKDIREKKAIAKEAYANKKAVVFLDIHKENPGKKTLLDGASLVLESGKVNEIGGAVGKQVLKTLAERERNSQGTTIIRTTKQGVGDINVHENADRSEIEYFDCQVDPEHRFFDGMNTVEALELLKNTGLFTKKELISLEENAKRTRSLKSISRSTQRRMAVAENLQGEETVTILNNVFEDLDSAEKIRLANYLEREAQNRVLVVRADEGIESADKNTLKRANTYSEELLEDEASMGYRRYLASRGSLESYVQENNRFEQAPLTHEDIIYMLEQQGNETIKKWPKNKKYKFAEEMVKGYASLEEVNGELLRVVPEIAIDIYTRGPNGEVYKVVQEHKVEKGAAGQALSKERVNEPHTMFRSLRGDAQTTMQLRLEQMGLDLTNAKHTRFEDRVVRKESGGYPGLNAKYEIKHAMVEIPYEELAEKERIIAPHDSGGFTYFKIEKVEKDAELEKAKKLLGLSN